jgi:hypothetical protein
MDSNGSGYGPGQTAVNTVMNLLEKGQGIS